MDYTEEDLLALIAMETNDEEFYRQKLEELRTEKRTALIAELRGFAEGSTSARASLMRDAADAIEALMQPEYEYAVRDESPTGYYGDLYNVGCTEEQAKYYATGRGYNDTAMRRRKAGPWEEVPNA